MKNLNWIKSVSAAQIYKTADRKSAMPSLLGPCLKEHFWRYFVFIFLNCFLVFFGMLIDLILTQSEKRCFLCKLGQTQPFMALNQNFETKNPTKKINTR